MEPEHCIWCGASVEQDDGWRAVAPDGGRAVFCRLEHVVPWHMQGPHWEVGDGEAAGEITGCSHCGAPDAGIVLIRHRGEHRISDGFCSAEHMAEWAKAGGRWR